MEANTAMPETPENLEALLASLTAAENAEKDPGFSDASKPVVKVTASEPIDENDLLADLNSIGTGEVSDDLLADLEATTARAEVYAAQTANNAISTNPAGPAKEKKERKKKADGAAQRQPRQDLASLPDAIFEVIVGAPIDKSAVIAKRPAQVKIAEKFDNLFQSLAAGKEPSRYVVTAYKVLKKAGQLTSADVIAAYRAEGLKDGTASSQTGQVMNLFDTVGIAQRVGRALTLRADSAIAKRLDAILGL